MDTTIILMTLLEKLQDDLNKANEEVARLKLQNDFMNEEISGLRQWVRQWGYK